MSEVKGRNLTRSIGHSIGHCEVREGHNCSHVMVKHHKVTSGAAGHWSEIMSKWQKE